MLLFLVKCAVNFLIRHFSLPIFLLYSWGVLCSFSVLHLIISPQHKASRHLILATKFFFSNLIRIIKPNHTSNKPLDSSVHHSSIQNAENRFPMRHTSFRRRPRGWSRFFVDDYKDSNPFTGTFTPKGGIVARFSFLTFLT